MLLRYRIVFFDLDGTLIEQKSCWWMLHEFFGTMEEAKKHLEEYLNGKIDYREWINKDVSLWIRKVGRIHVSEIERIVSNYKLCEGAEEVFEGLRSLGIKTVIITGGIDLLAEMVRRRLGADLILANKLAVDEEGYLTGEGIGMVDPQTKGELLVDVTRSFGMKPEEVIAVGDTEYDLGMLRAAGLGLYLGTEEGIEGTVRIGSLREVLRYAVEHRDA